MINKNKKKPLLSTKGGFFVNETESILFWKSIQDCRYNGIFSVLTTREFLVIYALFYFGYSCAEVSRAFIVSGSRIRQIRDKSLRKLRRSKEELC